MLEVGVGHAAQVGVDEQLALAQRAMQRPVSHWLEIFSTLLPFSLPNGLAFAEASSCSHTHCAQLLIEDGRVPSTAALLSESIWGTTAIDLQAWTMRCSSSRKREL